MFLQNRPDILSGEETNVNVVTNNKYSLLGIFELPFTIETVLNLTDKTSFSYSIQTIDSVFRLHLKELSDNEHKIKISLPITSPNAYTIYNPQRLDYLSRDVKYFSKYVTIVKSEYMANRYILKTHLYINDERLDEIYEGITKISNPSNPNNILFISVKDMLIFALSNNYYGTNLYKISMENIKNTILEPYKLTQEYKIKPYKYQLENVQWCKNVETSVNNVDSFTILNGYDDKIKLDSYYLLNDNILYIHGKSIINPTNFKTMKYFFHIQGGLLCDNTGLGKTLTLSIHITDDNTTINKIITDRMKTINDYIENITNTTVEDIELNKDTLINLLSKEVLILKNENNVYYKLKTNCNLLIVPVRLLQQWETEIKSYISTNKIYLINTVRDFYKLKLENIENYTVIIISVTFLQNDKRFLHPDGYDITHILWKRIIVDEIHEFFNSDANSRRNFDVVNKLNSLYKWGISATPPLNPNCDNIIKFLTHDNYWVNETIVSMNRYNRICTDIQEYRQFINSYYRYNVQIKVNTEIFIPKHEEHIIELEMSNIEKLLYNNATGDTKRMIALCTNYRISSQDSQLSGFATVSELKNRMLDQHTKKKNEHLEKIAQENKIIGFIKELIEWLYTDRVVMPDHIKINYCIITGNYDAYNIMSKNLNIINDEIESVSKKLESKEKQIEILKKELKLIEAKENMIDKFNSMIEDNLNEPCMICFGNLDSVMITACNHMYCGLCVNQLFKNTPNIKCPMCRTELTRSDVNSIVDKNLNLISADDMKKKIENKEEENINVSSGGTKIEAIVKYIKDTKDKIIIFATEKQTLDLMNTILDENKIKYVNLKGNAYVVSKQLKRFKTGEEQVILLSADRANSGTNLIEASHVILLDTHLISDGKSKKDIEKQAIGRAVRLGQKNNVKIVRFIMKNTIEQVYLNKV